MFPLQSSGINVVVVLDRGINERLETLDTAVFLVSSGGQCWDEENRKIST